MFFRFVLTLVRSADSPSRLVLVAGNLAVQRSVLTAYCIVLSAQIRKVHLQTAYVQFCRSQFTVHGDLAIFQLFYLAVADQCRDVTLDYGNACGESLEASLVV